MTATAGLLLMNAILPLIEGAIAKGAIKPVGAEDREELTADGCAIAARMLDSAERKGKEINPRSVAHYTLQSMKSGRRAGSAGRQDVMSPAAALDGGVKITSLDAPLGCDDDGEDYDLHDLLAGGGEDVDTAVARRLDWYDVEARLDRRRRQVLRETVQGYGPTEIAQKLHASVPRIVQLRQSCAAAVEQAWGVQGLPDTTFSTVWRSGLRATMHH